VDVWGERVAGFVGRGEGFVGEGKGERMLWRDILVSELLVWFRCGVIGGLGVGY